MPYNDFGEEVPSVAEKKTGLLTFGDIGGVGELVYHNFRFSNYTILEDDANLLAVPVVNAETPADLEQREDLDGNRILTSLCDLARKINSYETKDEYQVLILQWCKQYMHPYRIDALYQMLSNEEDIDPEIIGKLAEQDGAFYIQDFIKQLGELYNAALLKKALDGVAIAEEDDAYNLYEEGRFFTTPAIFERYKLRRPEIPESVFEGINDILKAMEREQEYIKDHPQEELQEGEFAYEPYDDYEVLRSRLLEMFPDFKLRLKTHPKDGRIVLSAEVDSVFDIAWYSLAHLITEEPLPQDIGKPILRPDGMMTTCKNCGRFFIRRSARNHYCDLVECQKARNASNQRAFRDRRRKAKKHSMNGPDN